MATPTSDYHSTDQPNIFNTNLRDRTLIADNHSTEYRPLFNTNLIDRPLFGADTPRDKIVNLVVGFVTALLVLITVILSFSLHHWSIWGLNVFFSICIMFSCSGHLLLVHWYRQGDLDPKFRNLIYLNSLTIAMLCICAMCYITVATDTQLADRNSVTTTTAPKLE